VSFAIIVNVIHREKVRLPLAATSTTSPIRGQELGFQIVAFVFVVETLDICIALLLICLAARLTICSQLKLSLFSLEEFI
jgi:hypothetical protein